VGYRLRKKLNPRTTRAASGGFKLQCIAIAPQLPRNCDALQRNCPLSSFTLLLYKQPSRRSLQYGRAIAKLYLHSSKLHWRHL